jgi:flagellar biosynthesis chaperone FliJ
VNEPLKQDVREARKWFEWALDTLDQYDTRLAEIDGKELVYSAVHVDAKKQARAALQKLYGQAFTESQIAKILRDVKEADEIDQA